MGGGQRHENFSYPDEHYYYYILAEKFGWTPNEIDDQPAARMDWILAIATAANEAENQKIEKKRK